jgi:hypothetical protein
MQHGFVLLVAHATVDLGSLLHHLECWPPPSEWNWMPHLQPDKLRRTRLLHAGAFADLVRRICSSAISTVLGTDDVPLYRPSCIATMPGAADQVIHRDVPTEDSFSIIIAFHCRVVTISGRDVRMSPGDTLVFDASREHFGRGLLEGAPHPCVAAHAYAGRGVQVADLTNTYEA